MSFAEFNMAYPWLEGMLALCAACAAGALVHRIFITVAVRITSRTATQADDRIIAHIRRPLGLFLPPAAALLTLPLVTLTDDLYQQVRHLLVVVLIISVGWGVLGTLHALGEIVVGKFRIDHADNLAQRQLQTRVLVFNRIAAVIVVLTTLAMVLMTFPGIRALGVSLFASAGVAGIAIGLAARPTISNLIAGIQIALTQPIRVDDVVIVEGEWGWIEEIATTYVVVRIWDQRRLVVPLSHFIEKPFQNWTRKTADIIGSIFLHADYTVPVDELRDELKRLAQDHPKWDGKVCVLQVTDAKERSLELRALVSARNSPDAWDLRCDLREGLIGYLQRKHPQCLPRLRAEIDGLAADGDRVIPA